MGGLPWLDAARPERFRQGGELGGRLLRDLFDARPRLQPLWVDEQGLKDPADFLLRQILEGEGVDCLGRAREVGMDLEPVHVADDEQGRVVERFTVAQELIVGSVEVLVLSLVLPGEVSLFPNIGPAFPTPVFRCPLVKRV